MTKDAFLARLRAGLRGLSPAAVDEIIADHRAHFDEGLAAGRTEADVSAALGDPDRLAREMSVEQAIERWQTERNPSAAAGAVFAVLGLAAFDIIIILPILMTVLSVLFGCFVAAIVVFFVGGGIFAAGPFMDLPGGAFGSILFGLGLMLGSVSAGSLMTLIVIGLVNLLVWYGRLHYRLLKPAIA